MTHNPELDVERCSHEELKSAYYSLLFLYEEMTPDDEEFNDLSLALHYHATRQASGRSNCSKQVVKAVHALMNGRVLSRGQLLAHISEREDAGGKLVDVTICKARKVLARFNAEIETIIGLGWIIRRPSIDKIKREVKRYQDRDIISFS